MRVGKIRYQLKAGVHMLNGWVKHEGTQNEEFGILEMWENGIICVETRTYVGASFFRSQVRYDVERCDIEL